MNAFGIEITGHKVLIAAVERRLRGIEIRGLQSIPAEKSGADTLMEVMAGFGYDPADDRAAVIFPGERISSRVMTVPLVKRQQILETLPYEIESVTPFGAEDITADYGAIETTDKGTRLLACFALRSAAASVLAALHEAGVEPDMVIPAPLAPLAVMGQVTDGGAARVILRAGYGSTDITLVKGSTPVFIHNAPIGVSDMLSGGAGGEEGLRRALSNAPAGHDDEWEGPISSFATALARETRKAIIAADMGSPAGIIMVGYPGCSGRLRAALEAELGAKTAEASYPAAGGADTEHAAAIAGALIAAGAGRGDAVNLAPDRRRGRKAAKSRAQAGVAAALAALALLLGALSFAVEQVNLGRRYESLRNEVRESFHRALPSVTKVVSESQQLKNALAKMEEKSKLLGGALLESDPFLDRLYDVSRAAPEDMKLDVDELVYEQEKIIMSGRTESYEKVELLRKNIEKLPWAAKVTVERAKASPTSGAINFRIEAAAK